MSVTAGTNCLTQTEDKLAAMLANSSAFQTFVGAANATEAAAKIYFDDFPRPANTAEDEYTAAEWIGLHPCALIIPPESGEVFSFDQIANSGNRIDYIMSTAFHVEFSKMAASANDQEESRLLKNSVGDIIDEVLTMSGNANYYGFTRVSPVGAPYYLTPSDQAAGVGDVYAWIIQFERSSNAGA